jgi:hypothetical protein
MKKGRARMRHLPKLTARKGLHVHACVFNV